jgi:hypothetical protein
MRIQTKRTLQVALVSGGLLMVGTGSASAAETVDPGSVSPLDQIAANPGLHDAADAINSAHPVQTLTAVLPAVTQQRPAAATEAPVAVLHAVPVHLLQQVPAPSAEVNGDQPEQDLNAPLGSELAATDLPVLPVLPLRGDVSTQPLNPGAGTRVTGLQNSGASAEAVQSTYDRRADTPAATLPLLGSLLPSTNGVLPTQAPTLNGLPDVTQLAGSTPLTHGGRYNTNAVTAPLTQHGPAALVESATALLHK